MKYLKSRINFDQSLNESLKNRVNKKCNKYQIKNWSLNSEGLVDVEGSVYLRGLGLSRIPLKFGKVTGDFYCNDNQLTSLEGCPSYVGMGFYCGHNKLNSLEGCPKHIGGEVIEILDDSVVMKVIVTKSRVYPK